MGHTPHLSRREILRSVPLLGPGSLLLPLNVLRGERPEALAVFRSARDGCTKGFI